MSSRLCAISVDLDEIPNYHAIYGLPPPEQGAATAVYDVAIPRLQALAERHAIPLTLFAIGADLQREASVQALAQMASLGHEIANHSYDHHYDLTRRGADEMRRQVDRGAEAIARATGKRPVGFRSPGYVTTDGLVQVLIETGHTYDSSVFPCPPYFAAKAAAMAWIALRGRKSHSVQDAVRVLLAPTRPYRPGPRYHQKGQLPIVEFPVQVTRGPRLPYIGTSLVLARAAGARRLTRLVLGEPMINLELHGIDLLDVHDGLQALAGHAPDIRIPHQGKSSILGGVIDQLKQAGYEFVTLQRAATLV